MPLLTVLVGLPASGKSTFVEEECKSGRNVQVISSDDYIQQMADQEGTTYNEAFHRHIDDAAKYIRSCAEAAKLANRDVIWDQTNLTPKKRKNILSMFPDYKKMAIVFEVDETVRQQRADGRHGKSIPDNVIENMKKSFIFPTKDEGFDYIVVEESR